MIGLFIIYILCHFLHQTILSAIFISNHFITLFCKLYIFKLLALISNFSVFTILSYVLANFKEIDYYYYIIIIIITKTV